MELFPLGVFAASNTPANALANAEIHYQHEVDEMRARAQKQRLFNLARGGGSADFTSFPSHRCVPGQCQLVSAPEREIVFACPLPHEHPPHKRNSDGSVLHRWSGVISVCYQYGVPHTCTAGMCSHQVRYDNQTTCSLTGRMLDPTLVSVVELPYSFDSGKALTVGHLHETDLDAVRGRIDCYMESRPEHKHTSAQQAAARADSAEMLKHGTKRALDLHGSERHMDGRRTAGPIGLLRTEEEPRQRLTITDRLAQGPQTLAPPIVLASQPGAKPRAVSSTHPFSVIGDGPTDTDIRHHFRVTATQLWDNLEMAYNMRMRMDELARAECRVIERCIDRRRLCGNRNASSAASSSSSAPMLFHEIASIHSAETRTAFEGMQYVRILAGWPPWTSGELRRTCIAELERRMWALWEVITRSPKFQQRQEPQLFQRVVGAMLSMVIKGYRVKVCCVEHDGCTFYRQKCTHSKEASDFADCGHREVTVALIAPYTVMQQLLEPEGMTRRALNPVCRFIHGHLNTVITFLSSLVEGGLTARQLKQIHVGPINR